MMGQCNSTINSKTQYTISESNQPKMITAFSSEAIDCSNQLYTNNYKTNITPFKFHDVDRKYLVGGNISILTFLLGYTDIEKNNVYHPVFTLGTDCMRIIISYARNGRSIPYSGDPLSQGIIYWLSSNNPFDRYINPIYSGILEVDKECHYHMNYSRSNDIYRVFSNPSFMDRDCYFDPGIIIFSFPFHNIHPTGYTFKNGGGRGSVIRKWVLEGANSSEGPWTILSNHEDDTTFLNDVSSGNEKGLSFLGHSWPIHVSHDQWFSYFRLRNLQIHTSSSRAYALYISGFELFGSVYATRSYIYNPELLKNDM